MFVCCSHCGKLYPSGVCEECGSTHTDIHYAFGDYNEFSADISSNRGYYATLCFDNTLRLSNKRKNWVVPCSEIKKIKNVKKLTTSGIVVNIIALIIALDISFRFSFLVGIFVFAGVLIATKLLKIKFGRGCRQIAITTANKKTIKMNVVYSAKSKKEIKEFLRVLKIYANIK